MKIKTSCPPLTSPVLFPGNRLIPVLLVALLVGDSCKNPSRKHQFLRGQGVNGWALTATRANDMSGYKKKCIWALS